VKRLCSLALFLPLLIQAQEFTRNADNAEQGTTEALLLVVPVNPLYVLSELDRKLSPDGDVAQMRDKLRKALNRRVTEIFSDSLNTYDLLMDDLENVNRLEFMYKGMDLSYMEIIPEKEEKKLLQWPKKKEQEYNGSEVKVEQGQLKREEILEKQYKGLSQVDPVMMEYMRSQTTFSQMLVLTQVELRKNVHPRPGQEEPYLFRLHYSLLNYHGALLSGGVIEKGMKDEDVAIDRVSNDIFVYTAAELLRRLDPFFDSPVEVKEKKIEHIDGQEDY